MCPNSNLVAAIVNSLSQAVPPEENITDELLRCRFLDQDLQPLVCQDSVDLRQIILEVPNARLVNLLWNYNEVLRNVGLRYGVEDKIVLKSGTIDFEVLIKPPVEEVVVARNPNGLEYERSLLAKALLSGHPFAVVRMADNCVIQAGQDIAGAPVPPGWWTGFDITALWSPDVDTWAEYRAGVGRRSPGLDRIYRLLSLSTDSTGLYLPDLDCTTFLARLQDGKIVRGDLAQVKMDIYRLDHYFGETCRLSIMKEYQVLGATASPVWRYGSEK